MAGQQGGMLARFPRENTRLTALEGQLVKETRITEEHIYTFCVELNQGVQEIGYFLPPFLPDDES
jgi:hypothetical protein